MIKTYMDASTVEMLIMVHEWLRLRLLSMSEYHGTGEGSASAMTLWLHGMPKTIIIDQHNWLASK